MKKITLFTAMLVLAGCANSNGQKGTVFNPVPYAAKQTEATDVIASTSETIIAGMGIVDRQILCDRARKVTDLPTHRFLDYAGHLPNGGLLPIWKV